IEGERQRSIGAVHSHRQRSRVAPFDHRGSGAAAQAHGDAAVRRKAGADVGNAAQPFEHQVALIEQAGPVAAAGPGARQAHVDAGELAGENVRLVDRRARFELGAFGHRVQALGGNVELVRHRLGRRHGRGPQCGIDGIGAELAQRAFELDDGREDIGLFDRALDVFEAAQLRRGARCVRMGPAHFGLAEHVGVTVDAGNAHARQRDVAGPQQPAGGRDLLHAGAAPDVSVRRGVGDVLRGHVERGAGGARAALGDREEVGRHRLALVTQMARQLRFDARGKAERAALAGELGELRIAHLAESLFAFTAEQLVAAEVGASGSGEHLAHEDRLELLRGFLQLRALAGVRAGRAGKCGSGAGRDRRDHITTISALSEPACFSASRIATRSAGLAPSMFSASTTCASDAPGSNMVTRLPGCSISMALLCSPAVCPRLNGSGCTTIGSSSIRTTMLPWLIAAGARRTALEMTTVPVRLLTMTRAALSAGSTSIISIAAIMLARALESSGRCKARVTPSSTEAVPGNCALIASRTREAVRKSACDRFQRSTSDWSNPVCTIRSTLAPSGMRPTVGTLTVSLEPSRPETPRPPTARLPCAIA